MRLAVYVVLPETVGLSFTFVILHLFFLHVSLMKHSTTDSMCLGPSSQPASLINTRLILRANVYSLTEIDDRPMISFPLAKQERRKI